MMTSSSPKEHAADAGASLATLLDQVALAQAADLARRGHYAQAAGLLSEMAGRQPTPVAALDLLARIRAQEGRLDEARALWAQALEVEPGNAPAQAALRRIAALEGRRLRPGFLRSAVAPVVAAGLLGVSAWWLADRMGRSDRALQGLTAEVMALQQKMDQHEMASSARSQPTPVPDLTGPVRQALQADADLAACGLQVRQAGSGIVLGGSVPTVELKERAEALAGGVAGVALVDSSAVAVTSPPLAGAVLEALRADARTAGLQLQVEQAGRDVLLKGAVPSLEARAAAEAVAHGVPGVELVDAAALRVEPRYIEYTVQPGDSLSSIAKAQCGDPLRWPAIYEANKERIADPWAIVPGMVLRIPVPLQP